MGLALLFNAGLWWHLSGTVGQEIADREALEFLTGYLIEKSLSMDNVFVFLLIFSSFHVAAEHQRCGAHLRRARRHRHACRHLRISEGHHGEKFTVMKDGVRYFTPLFLVR